MADTRSRSLCLISHPHLLSWAQWSLWIMRTFCYPLLVSRPILTRGRKFQTRLSFSSLWGWLLSHSSCYCEFRTKSPSTDHTVLSCSLRKPPQWSQRRQENLPKLATAPGPECQWPLHLSRPVLPTLWLTTPGSACCWQEWDCDRHFVDLPSDVNYIPQGNDEYLKFKLRKLTWND